MSRLDVLDHPDVASTLRTGHPTFAQPKPEEPKGEPETKYDEETIDAVFETFDEVLKNYLPDNLRAEVWNKASRKFPGC